MYFLKKDMIVCYEQLSCSTDTWHFNRRRATWSTCSGCWVSQSVSQSVSAGWDFVAERRWWCYMASDRPSVRVAAHPHMFQCRFAISAT